MCWKRSRNVSQKLWDNTRYFKQGLAAAGFNTGVSETPITPVIVGEARMAHALSAALFEEGVLATGIGFPTVPEGKARVRTIVTATHTRAELDQRSGGVCAGGEEAGNSGLRTPDILPYALTETARFPMVCWLQAAGEIEGSVVAGFRRRSARHRRQMRQ